jgi:hypothetical protein
MNMTKKFVGLLAGATLLAGTTAASAQTIDVGLVSLDDPSTFTGVIPIGSFIDTVTFTLPDNGGSAYSVVNVPLSLFGSTFDLIFSSIALFSNADGILFNGDDALLTSTVASSTELSLSNGPTAAGNYYLTIAGVATGSAGGIYAGAIDVAPVPVPPAVWMLGSAIVGLATVGRRKSA